MGVVSKGTLRETDHLRLRVSAPALIDWNTYSENAKTKLRQIWNVWYAMDDGSEDVEEKPAEDWVVARVWCRSTSVR